MKAFSFTAILSNVLSLGLVLRLLTGDRRLAILAATFFFAFIPNTWDHNLLTAYPVTSTLAMTMFFMSVALWWTAVHGAGGVKGWHRVERWGRGPLVVLSTACYCFSLLVYESFLPYVVVFPLMAMTGASSWADRIRKAIRTPHVWAFATVVLLTVAFRVFLSTESGRAAMTAEQYSVNLDPRAVGRVLERWTASALPLHYFRAYRDLVNDYYLGFGSFKSHFIDLFRIFEMTWLIKAAMVAFLVASLVASRTLVRHRALALCFALVVTILTHLPLAVSSKYQIWVIQFYNHGYMTSYLSFLGVVAFFALTLDALVGAAARWNRRLGHLAVALVTVAAFLTSYGTDFLNAHVSQSQFQMYDKWQAVDRWIDSDAFRRLPDDAVVLAPTLWDVNRGQTVLWDDYWSRYVQQYGRKRVHMAKAESDWRAQAAREVSAGKTYYLKFMRERRDDDAFVVFGRVSLAGPGQPLSADSLLLLTHARSEYLRVVGRLHDVAPGCRARVFVDGAPSSGTFDEGFGVHVDKLRPDTDWLWTTLTSERGVIDPESIAVASSSERMDGAVDVRYGRGFFPDEIAHRWAENEADIQLINRSDRVVTVNVKVRLRAPEAVKGTTHAVEVLAGETTVRWPISDRFEKRSFPVTLQPRDSVTVTFKTDAPRIPPEQDVRNLVLMFVPPIAAFETDTCDR